MTIGVRVCEIIAVLYCQCKPVSVVVTVVMVAVM